MRRGPAHAGSLRLNERLAFVMMFTVMAAFVVGLSVLAAKTARAGIPLVAVSARTELAGSGAQQPCPVTKGGVGLATRTWPAQRSRALDARLARALRQRLRADMGQLSVGVVDPATGTEAFYHASEHYHAAGIAGADILAVLMYQYQEAKTAISSQDRALAAGMIERGNRTAAGRLWQAIGRGAALTVANRALGLQHTIPGAADAWALTRTTIADQVQLLTDLATTRSTLTSACRHYELSLMTSAAATQHWGVSAAASPGTSYAVNCGGQADPRRFVVNSLGVIDHAGREVLVVVMSRNWRTEAAGISVVRTAAVAAASTLAMSR